MVTVLHISTTNPMEGALPIDPFLLAVSVKKLAEEQLAASEYDSKIVTYLGGWHCDYPTAHGGGDHTFYRLHG